MAETRAARQVAARDIVMVSYVIYEHPKDYPDKFVVRRWAAVRGEREPLPEKDPVGIVDSLEAARALVPVGCVRSPVTEPDPVVREVWI